MSDQVRNISRRTNAQFALAGSHELVLRQGFVYREDVPLGDDVSDRSLPAVVDSPPARRLISPRGGALRLELVLIALRQLRPLDASAGHVNLSMTLPRGADRGRLRALVDVFASGAERSHATGMSEGPNDKRARHVRSAVRRLIEQGLARPGDPFVLLQEDASGPGAMAADYRKPTRTEPQFTLPMSFITNGWVHVLEDRELLVLMMVACGAGSLELGDKSVAIPGVVRVHRYGVGRDSFGASCAMLDTLGLINVDADARHDDGRVVGLDIDDARLSLSRLTLLEVGFGRDAVKATEEVLVQLLGS